MSNYWDLYCVTCSVKASAFHWNDGARWLRELIQFLPALGSITTAFEKMPDTVAAPSIREGRWWSLSEWEDKEALFAFVRDHGAHDIRPRSEYGYTDDQCGNYWQCRACQTSHVCNLNAKHDGECGPRLNAEAATPADAQLDANEETKLALARANDALAESARLYRALLVGIGNALQAELHGEAMIEHAKRIMDSNIQRAERIQVMGEEIVRLTARAKLVREDD